MITYLLEKCWCHSKVSSMNHVLLPPRCCRHSFTAKTSIRDSASVPLSYTRSQQKLQTPLIPTSVLPSFAFFWLRPPDISSFHWFLPSVYKKMQITWLNIMQTKKKTGLID